MKKQPIAEFLVQDDLRPTLCVAGLENEYEDIKIFTKAEILNLYDSSLNNIDDLIEASNECQELRCEILEYIYFLQKFLCRKLARSKQRSPGKRAQANRARWSLEIDLLPATDDDLERWLRQLNAENFKDLYTYLKNWLYDEPEAPADGIRQAYNFFQNLPAEQLEILGVSLVDGEFPGSDYFAAELDISIEEANQAAKQANLPIRFLV
jgi:hypothetical protein